MIYSQSLCNMWCMLYKCVHGPVRCRRLWAPKVFAVSEKMESINLKILLIGDSGTGKSRYGY